MHEIRDKIGKFVSPKDVRDEQWMLKEGSMVTGMNAMATGKTSTILIVL